ncbi:hypothetical protein JL09_g5850 [Pichia kudriavzevii]|uniref:Uncharacterized protein n=1 Tax=Pichia kudriavzevii TaxID=4909 RepID=A0A099NT05_PICKU|nr:hypothetical protein JL09_g5850 [Pichia kudriavzevii]
MALKKSNNCKAPYRINQVSQRGSFVPNSKRPELNSEYAKMSPIEEKGRVSRHE